MRTRILHTGTVGHEEIEPAVAVEVQECRARAPSTLRQARSLGIRRWLLLLLRVLVILLVALTAGFVLVASRRPHLAAPWRRVARSRVGMGAAVVLAARIVGMKNGSRNGYVHTVMSRMFARR